MYYIHYKLIKSTVNSFNDVFTNVGSDLAETLSYVERESIYDCLCPSNTHTHFFKSTDEKEILDIVKTSNDCNVNCMLVAKM